MKKNFNTYKKSGVNIDLGNKLVKYISTKLKKNSNKSNNKDIGAFASSIDLAKAKIRNPLVVACTDGVGTKIEIANLLKIYDTIGIDLVAMSVNDLAVLGAKPLFFLDYLAVGKLNLSRSKKIINGIIKGCKEAECDLVGGETAEMPGTYLRNKFDLAGFAVGVVSKEKILPKKNINPSDIILAIPSSGIHSNGYSLIRKIIKNKKINHFIKKELIRPTKIYTKEIFNLCQKNLIKSAAHITGGGLLENLGRSVPKNLSINIDLSKIKIKKIFKWIKNNNISDQEMMRTFNCGVGFCLVVNKKNSKKISKYFKKQYKPYPIGWITKSKKRFNLINQIKW